MPGTVKPLNAGFDLGGVALIPRFTDAIAATVTAGTVTCALTDGAVTTTTITAAGAGYAYAPTLTASSGAATFTATVNPLTGAITAVTITEAGSGYGAAPTIAVSGGYSTSPTTNATAKLLVPQSAVYFYVKNRIGGSGTVTITILKDTTAATGSIVLAAGEEIILPCAGIGYINKTSGGNNTGDYPQYIQVVAAASTYADWFFACMTPDGQ